MNLNQHVSNVTQLFERVEDTERDRERAESSLLCAWNFGTEMTP